MTVRSTTDDRWALIDHSQCVIKGVTFQGSLIVCALSGCRRHRLTFNHLGAKRIRRHEGQDIQSPVTTRAQFPPRKQRSLCLGFFAPGIRYGKETTITILDGTALVSFSNRPIKGNVIVPEASSLHLIFFLCCYHDRVPINNTFLIGTKRTLTLILGRDYQGIRLTIGCPLLVQTGDSAHQP